MRSASRQSSRLYRCALIGQHAHDDRRCCGGTQKECLAATWQLGPCQRGGQAIEFKMKCMANTYEAWIGEVQRALDSINMSMDDWHTRWPFDFHAEYNEGTKATDAALKANHFWWREQNRSLDQDCRLTSECWLPRGHQGSCELVRFRFRAEP